MSNGEFMSKRIKTQVEEEEEGWWFLQYNIIIGFFIDFLYLFRLAFGWRLGWSLGCVWVVE